MEIGGIKSIDSQTTSASQMAKDQPVDVASKKIQDEISNVQRQMKNISSKEDLSADEKSSERRKMRQEINSLNAKLRARQAEVRKEQKKEVRREELREESKNGGKDEEERTKTGKANSSGKDAKKSDSRSADIRAAGDKKAVGDKRAADDKKAAADKSTVEDRGVANSAGTGVNEVKKQGRIEQNQREDSFGEQMQTVMSADKLVSQAQSRGTVITRMEEGIVILKGEINQDKARGIDPEEKSEELKKRQEKMRRALDLSNEDSSRKRRRIQESMRNMRVATENTDDRRAQTAKRSRDESMVIKAAQIARERSQDTTQFRIM